MPSYFEVMHKLGSIIRNSVWKIANEKILAYILFCCNNLLYVLIDAIPLEDDIDTESFQDKSLSTEQNGDELYEVSKESDNNSEIIAKKRVELLEADDYYADYFVKSKYLIFGIGRICSLFVAEDSEIVKEIPYENIASFDYNVIDGFVYVTISDKQNEEMTFTFRKEELPDIENEINSRYVERGR